MLPIPIPCGPMLIVCPLITVVSDGVLGPSEKVRPPITASEGAMENVTPSAVTADKLGGGVGIGIVVPATATPFGPMLMVLPFSTTVVGAWPGRKE